MCDVNSYCQGFYSAILIGISIAISVLPSFKLFLAGDPLLDLGRLRLCFPIGERLRDGDLPRAGDDFRLRDSNRLELEGEGMPDS